MEYSGCCGNDVLLAALKVAELSAGVDDSSKWGRCDDFCFKSDRLCLSLAELDFSGVQPFIVSVSVVRVGIVSVSVVRVGTMIMFVLRMIVGFV